MVSPLHHNINAGVLQGLVLRPTLFSVYINDLPDGALSRIGIYADKTMWVGLLTIKTFWYYLHLKVSKYGRQPEPRVPILTPKKHLKCHT